MRTYSLGMAVISVFESVVTSTTIACYDFQHKPTHIFMVYRVVSLMRIVGRKVGCFTVYMYYQRKLVKFIHVVWYMHGNKEKKKDNMVMICT